MKQMILLNLIALTSIVAMAQTSSLHQSARYEAANWKTWLLDTLQLTVVAPPAAAQTKAELQLIKQGMATLDEKKLAQIKYWDAGALPIGGTRSYQNW